MGTAKEIPVTVLQRAVENWGKRSGGSPEAAQALDFCAYSSALRGLRNSVTQFLGALPVGDADSGNESTVILSQMFEDGSERGQAGVPSCQMTKDVQTYYFQMKARH